jgi:hypothetical protein
MQRPVGDEIFAGEGVPFAGTIARGLTVGLALSVSLWALVVLAAWSVW